MTKKFVYVDNATNQETEAEAYILEDYVSESGTPNAPLLTNSLGFLDESLLMPGVSENELFSVSSVAVGATVPVFSKNGFDGFIVNAVEVSGDCIGTFRLYKNSTLIAVKRLSYLSFNALIDLGGQKVETGDTLDMTVENGSKFIAAFEARIISKGEM
jgi:hypothetical protein